MKKLTWKLRILNYIQIFQKLMTQVPVMGNGIKQRYIVQPIKDDVIFGWKIVSRDFVEPWWHLACDVYALLSCFYLTKYDISLSTICAWFDNDVFKCDRNWVVLYIFYSV